MPDGPVLYPPNIKHASPRKGRPASENYENRKKEEITMSDQEVVAATESTPVLSEAVAKKTGKSKTKPKAAAKKAKPNGKASATPKAKRVTGNEVFGKYHLNEVVRRLIKEKWEVEAIVNAMRGTGFPSVTPFTVTWNKDRLKSGSPAADLSESELKALQKAALNAPVPYQKKAGAKKSAKEGEKTAKRARKSKQ